MRHLDGTISHQTRLRDTEHNEREEVGELLDLVGSSHEFVVAVKALQSVSGLTLANTMAPVVVRYRKRGDSNTERRPCAIKVRVKWGLRRSLDTHTG